jgi:hypothetical protein
VEGLKAADPRHRPLDPEVVALDPLLQVLGDVMQRFLRQEPLFRGGRNHAVILPMSGKKLRSITAGTRSMDAVFDVSMSSGAPAAKSFTSRWLPESSSS